MPAGSCHQDRSGRAPAAGFVPSAGAVLSGASRTGTIGRGALLGLVLVCGVAGMAAGQRRIRVTGQRSLTFGSVLPGVSRSVSRTDPLSSGMIDIRAARFTTLQLVFSLPATMTGPAGATLPLSFGPNDAGFSVSRSVSNQVGFDPRVGYVASMGVQTRATVFLGGTARPQASQRAGSYSATVTLTVAYLP